MFDSTLLRSVEQFANLTQALSEADLERPWGWGDYTGEGVRFAFFRVYEELRTLAARLERRRALSTAQRILAGYHAAYRDLQAALLNVSADLAAQPPAEKEWPARKALAHIVGADVGFYGVIQHALDQHRRGNWQPAKIPDEMWEPLIGMPDADFDALMDGPFEGMVAYHRELHTRILRAFSTIAEDELEKPALFWESQPMTIRFRLHRFDSHMRQHTVQIDKTLDALGHRPTEARRLLRLIYAALAQAEGATLGAEATDAEIEQTANNIVALTNDVGHALSVTTR